MAIEAPRVLIFEDHEDTRDLYVEYLVDSGFTVFATGSAEEAIAIASGEAIEVVTLDLSAGLRLARELVTLPKPPRLIAVTGRPPAGARDEALFAAYLVKPCLPDDLKRAIEGILARR
jgi:CheY-like chemotaxis protein